MNKTAAFKYGVEVFINHYCGRDRDTYIHLMHNGPEDGYVVAVRQYYRWSGGLKVDERDELFQNNVIPAPAAQAFKELELQYFGSDLISHRKVRT